jgi:hypothetical protein
MVFQRKSKKRMSMKKMSRKNMGRKNMGSKNIYRGGQNTELDENALLAVNEDIISILVELNEDTDFMNQTPEKKAAELRGKIEETYNQIKAEETCEYVGSSNDKKFLQRELFNQLFPTFNIRNLKLSNDYDTLIQQVLRIRSISLGEDDEKYSNEKVQDALEQLCSSVYHHIDERYDEADTSDPEELVKIIHDAFNSFKNNYDSRSSSKKIDLYLYSCGGPLTGTGKRTADVYAIYDEILSQSDDTLYEYAEKLVKNKEAQLNGGNRRRRISRRRY